MNITLTVPDGTTNHGNPNLLCTPPYWYDFVLFYFANYIAHAATVISSPGPGSWSTVYVVIIALLIPVSGVIRAVSNIRRHACTEAHPLRRAARARALCMVVRAPLEKTISIGEPANIGDPVNANEADLVGKDNAATDKSEHQHGINNTKADLQR
jgi:hypothetical protein